MTTLQLICAIVLLSLTGCASHQAPSVSINPTAQAFSVVQTNAHGLRYVFCHAAECSMPSIKHLAEPVPVVASTQVPVEVVPEEVLSTTPLKPPPLRLKPKVKSRRLNAKVQCKAAS